MISTFSYTKISYKYEGQDLALAPTRSNTTIDWDKYPILITKTEMATMDMKMVLSVACNTALSPSSMAGLKSTEIDLPCLLLINAEFSKAMTEYKKALILASGEDLKTFKKTSTDFTGMQKGIVAGTTVGSTALCAGAGAAVGAFGGPPGMALGGALGALCGAVLGGGGSCYVINKENSLTLEREVCAHRIKWMYEVEFSEKKRYKRIESEIEKNSMLLLKELGDLRVTDNKQICLNRLMKLEQLNQVYAAIFPEKTLQIGQVNVPKHLEGLRSEIKNSCKLK